MELQNSRPFQRQQGACGHSSELRGPIPGSIPVVSSRVVTVMVLLLADTDFLLYFIVQMIPNDYTNRLCTFYLTSPQRLHSIQALIHHVVVPGSQGTQSQAVQHDQLGRAEQRGVLGRRHYRNGVGAAEGVGLEHVPSHCIVLLWALSCTFAAEHQGIRETNDFAAFMFFLRAVGDGLLVHSIFGPVGGGLCCSIELARGAEHVAVYGCG